MKKDPTDFKNPIGLNTFKIGGNDLNKAGVYATLT